jgi:hypothetical protein
MNKRVTSARNLASDNLQYHASKEYEASQHNIHGPSREVTFPRHPLRIDLRDNKAESVINKQSSLDISIQTEIAKAIEDSLDTLEKSRSYIQVKYETKGSHVKLKQTNQPSVPINPSKSNSVGEKLGSKNGLNADIKPGEVRPMVDKRSLIAKKFKKKSAKGKKLDPLVYESEHSHLSEKNSGRILRSQSASSARSQRTNDSRNSDQVRRKLIIIR